ncbi:RNA polymerase sigma-70 factor [Rhodothermaceae bacterium RA]|nr:RNA polymerase sigma-70 factor [Rhodothermaceae bacterium RA]
MSDSDPLASLCRRLQASDRDAFEALFRMLREGLLRYVHAIVHDDVVAHDLVQDVFVALWGLRETLDPSRPLRPYVYRMARNRALRYLRDERTHTRKEEQLREEADGHDPAADPGARLDEAVLHGYLRRCLAALPDRQREALVLSRYHHLSHREIAAVMEISPRTVNVHIMRALEHLQQRMQAFEPVPRTP